MLFLTMKTDKDELATLEIGAGLLIEGAKKHLTGTDEDTAIALLRQCSEALVFSLRANAEVEAVAAGKVVAVVEEQKRKDEFEENAKTSVEKEDGTEDPRRLPSGKNG